MEITLTCKYCNEPFTITHLRSKVQECCNKPECKEAQRKYWIELKRQRRIQARLKNPPGLLKQVTVTCRYCKEPFTYEKTYGSNRQSCDKPGCVEAAKYHVKKLHEKNKKSIQKKGEKEQIVLDNHHLILEFLSWRKRAKGRMNGSKSALSLMASMEVKSNFQKEIITVEIGGKEFEITPAGALAVGNDLVARAKRMMSQKTERM
jgi:hypothetical protein